MSGHSHWHSIKHAKAITDAKRSRLFSKLSKEIEVTAREGGDPEKNPKLRAVIEKAKSAQMPSENIERAIKRGTGELKGEKLEQVLYEAYGPGGTAILIEGITDNKNRTLNEIKQILNQHNGKLVDEGAVKWMFERKGEIIINLEKQDPPLKKEDIELLAIEAGAEDFSWPKENIFEIYTQPEELEKVKEFLNKKGIKTESASLGWKAKELIKIDQKHKESAERLFESLDDNDAVQEIYSNIDNL